MRSLSYTKSSKHHEKTHIEIFLFPGPVGVYEAIIRRLFNQHQHADDYGRFSFLPNPDCRRRIRRLPGRNQRKSLQLRSYLTPVLKLSGSKETTPVVISLLFFFSGRPQKTLTQSLAAWHLKQKLFQRCSNGSAFRRARVIDPAAHN